MKTLVINIARLGDLIQTGPLVKGLSAQGARVHLLVSDAFSEPAGWLPGAEKVISYPLGASVAPLVDASGDWGRAWRLTSELVQRLRAEGYDRVINITHTHFSAALTRLIGAENSIGITLDGRGFRRVNGAWANYYFNSCLTRAFNRFNLVDLHCKVGGVTSPGRLEIKLSDWDRTAAREFLLHRGLHGRRLVGVVPGASTAEKAWPAELIGDALCRLTARRQVVPVLLGSKSDASACDAVWRACPSSVNLCGITSLKLLAGLLEWCELVVSNDTGPMHIAAAVGTRVVDITLGSALAHETAPYGAGHIVIEPRIACHPCLPRMRCEHLSCHRNISPEVVVEVVEKMLSGSAIDAMPSAGIWDGINLYRTGFDANGLWKLTPLIRRPATLEDIAGEGLRAMWMNAFDEASPWSHRSRAEALRIGRQLSEAYVLNEGSAVIGGLFDALNCLSELAAEGQAAAERLAEISPDSSGIPLIAELGARLQQIDSAIVQAAHRRPETMPLAAQFTYGKDNLDGWELSSLAAQTASLYRSLNAWCKALPRWIAGILAGAGVPMNVEAA